MEQFKKFVQIFKCTVSFFTSHQDGQHHKNSPAYEHKSFSGQNAAKKLNVPVKETKQRAGQGEGLLEVFREKTCVKGRKDASDSELRSGL